jgi:AAA domain
MNQHPRSIVSEGIDCELRAIAGAAEGKEDVVFLQCAKNAVGYAIREGMDKVPIVDRLHQAGVALGLGDTYIQLCLSDAVELAETKSTAAPTSAGCGAPLPSAERSLVVRRASDIAPEAIEWIWRNRIALSKLWLIAGEPGLGKSQLASMIAATITTGGAWPCGEGHAKPGSVIMLCAEDGAADTIVPRLLAAGADLSRVHIVSAVAGGDRQGNRSFNLQADVDLLESCVARIEDVQLIVIDPISSYMGKGLDSHKNTDVRGVLEVVAEMAARRRVAVLGITHFSKGGGQKAINQFIGSIAFIAAARTAYAVMSDPEDDTRRLFMPVKNNLAPLGRGLAFRMEQRILVGDILASSVAFAAEPVDGTADTVLAANTTTNDGKSAVAEAREFLLGMLAAGPQPVTKIQVEAEGADISWASIKRAKKRSKEIGKQRVGGLGSDGRWDWFLKGTDAKGLNND